MTSFAKTEHEVVGDYTKVIPIIHCIDLKCWIKYYIYKVVFL